MSPRKRPMKPPINARAPPPLIIGHNCGYLGYNEKPYSRAATSKAYKDCDYLEIDLTRRKGKWWYYHTGLSGECKDDEEGNREGGVSFDDFLEDFRIAAEDAANKEPKPGIFLDLKKRLNHGQVDELMEYLNNKYKKKVIPKKTPLMIFTGRGLTPHFQSVYRHTTLYFVKWLCKHKKKAIMDSAFCPRLTLVTREIDIANEVADWKGILEPFRKSYLDIDERNWFLLNLNKRFWWAFNPELFWLFKYDFEQIIENEITVIPWFDRSISKIRRLVEKKSLSEEPAEADMARVPEKLAESHSAWIKVILGILGEYWSYRSVHDAKDAKPLLWGIISFAPSQLKDAFQKWSFNDIQ